MAGQDVNTSGTSVNELDSDSLKRLAAGFPMHTNIKRNLFLHETSYNMVEVKIQIHAVDRRACMGAQICSGLQFNKAVWRS